MPVDVQWDDRSIIIVRASGQLSMPDIELANVAIVNQLNGIAQGAGLVVDAKRLDAIPLDIRPLRDVLTFFEHEQLRRVAIVGMESTVLRFLVAVISEVVGRPILHFDSFESAVNYVLGISKPALA